MNTNTTIPALWQRSALANVMEQMLPAHALPAWHHTVRAQVVTPQGIQPAAATLSAYVAAVIAQLEQPIVDTVATAKRHGVGSVPGFTRMCRLTTTYTKCLRAALAQIEAE